MSSLREPDERRREQGDGRAEPRRRRRRPLCLVELDRAPERRRRLPDLWEPLRRHAARRLHRRRSRCAQRGGERAGRQQLLGSILSFRASAGADLPHRGRRRRRVDRRLLPPQESPLRRTTSSRTPRPSAGCQHRITATTPTRRASLASRTTPATRAGRSLWWRWTAPANGPVQIDTCGSYADYSTSTPCLPSIRATP